MTNGFHTESTKVSECLPVYMPRELKAIVGAEADKANIPMTEYVVRVLAEKVRRSDLAYVPRKRSGRPRKPLGPIKVSINGKRKRAS